MRNSSHRAFDFRYVENIPRHGKPDVPFRKADSVASRRISPVCRTRIFRQDKSQEFALFLRNLFKKRFRDANRKRRKTNFLRKASPRLGKRIRIRQIRFDVDDRGAVHQVCARNDDFRTFRRNGFDSFDFHDGKGDGIRSKGRTRRKDAHSPISAKTRRANGRAETASNVFRKNPEQPQVRKAFQSAERIRVSKPFLENDRRSQVFQNAALPRNTELFGEIRPDMRNRLKRKRPLHRNVYSKIF